MQASLSPTHANFSWGGGIIWDFLCSEYFSLWNQKVRTIPFWSICIFLLVLGGKLYAVKSCVGSCTIAFSDTKVQDRFCLACLISIFHSC